MFSVDSLLLFLDMMEILLLYEGLVNVNGMTLFGYFIHNFYLLDNFLLYWLPCVRYPYQSFLYSVKLHFRIILWFLWLFPFFITSFPLSFWSSRGLSCTVQSLCFYQLVEVKGRIIRLHDIILLRLPFVAYRGRSDM